MVLYKYFIIPDVFYHVVLVISGLGSTEKIQLSPHSYQYFLDNHICYKKGKLL